MIFLFFVSPVFAEKTCIVYFTKIGCPNCAVTDPIVLSSWTDRNDDLVVIEYMFWNWGEENAHLLGEYTQKYGTMSAVPQLFVTGEKVALGRIDIPPLEDDISNLKGNPCLVDGTRPFEELDLNKVQGNPLKIWSRGRLLVRTGDKEVSSDFLRELLFSDNLEKTINSSSYKIEEVEPEPAPISGGQIEFGKAIEIEDSWVLEFNEDVSIPKNEEEAEEDIIEIPFFGKINTKEMSLPVLTLLVAGADGFNPCAFFILTFLLSAMLYVRSRKRIIAVGGIFVFFSALIYFLFMTAWLNIFLIGSGMTLLTLIAGLIAITAGVINIKDFFFFKKGVSLTLPTSEKMKFFEKVKGLMKVESFGALLIGTIILAVTVNLYELLCTVGFPMVYIRILTLHNLSSLEYYLYLIFYNIVYVIPLAIIVAIFAITLGSKKFTVEGVKKLKLVSGFMILFLGLVLIFRPVILEDVVTTFGILIAAVVISGLIILVKKLKEEKSVEEKPEEESKEDLNSTPSKTNYGRED